MDTSVWSLALRRGGPAEHPTVDRLLEFLDSGEDLFLTGLILQEILQALRTEKAATEVAETLEPFPLQASTCLMAASLYRVCRRKGLGGSTIDCHIAATAIEQNCRLLATDRDFVRIARISPLELV